MPQTRHVHEGRVQRGGGQVVCGTQFADLRPRVMEGPPEEPEQAVQCHCLWSLLVCTLLCFFFERMFYC